MYTLESLPLIRVWLDADQLALTARMVMDGYNLPALGVVNSDRQLIGLVTHVELVGVSRDTKLSEVMIAAPESISSRMTVRQVAGELIRRDVDFIPVVKDNMFWSMVTSRSLLSKLRESYDPMTELPWSDALREWGINQLEKGVEIVILFVDLNNFGQFNKQFGHVVGDRVIQKVSAHLSSKIDSTSDVLVRYGGDEFAIGTSRDRDDAEELMDSILEDGHGLNVDGVDVPVTFSVGIYGGRRTKSRNNVHGASNLDDLVNLASRDCIARKEVSTEANSVKPEAEIESIPTQAVITVPIDGEPLVTVPATDESSSPQIPVVETVQADDEPNSLTYVVVRLGEKQFVGTSVKMGHTKADSIAIATGKALEKALPEVKVTIDSITVEQAGSTELVTARVRTVKGNLERDVTAQAEANGDLEDTIGLAVISAVLVE